ncbi:MAG TPA: hypothetical protein VM054_11960 [bacterium]|nr:hypothetical protein [bacterium]
MEFADWLGLATAICAAVAAVFSARAASKTAKATKDLAETAKIQTQLYKYEYIDRGITPDEKELRRRTADNL